VSWPVAVLALLLCAAVGATSGLLRPPVLRVSLLALAAVAAFAAFTPTACAQGTPGTEDGAVSGATSGWCENSFGLRLPEVGRADGEVGQGLATAAAALVLAGGIGSAALRRRTAVER
jgi:hypothetical protein